MKNTPMPRRKTPLKQVTPWRQPPGPDAAKVPVKPTRRVPLKASRRDDIPPEVRELVVDRDGEACLRCGHGIGDGPSSLHHRKRRSQGGAHTPENLVLLCGTGTTGCHGLVHARVAESRAQGWLVPGKVDPGLVPVPVLTPSGTACLWLKADGTRSAECPEAAA